MHLRTAVGVVELRVWYGLNPATRHWGCPTRQHWGLSAHQQFSPGLQDRLAFTATATGSYERAAAVAAKWGCPSDDTTIHALVQRLGARAVAQTEQRLRTVPREPTPARAPSALTVLELDGWHARHRGPGWGRKKTAQPRVEWHEQKIGVAYRHEQAGRTAGGRGLLSEKVVVSWQGEPLALGQRLHWEAMQRGLARSRDVLVGPTARHGSGTWRRIGGPVRPSCWTSTTPANTCGTWAGRCTVRRRLRRGSSPGCIGCATGKNARCCGNWRRCARRAARLAKWCAVSSNTLPAMPGG